MTHVRRPVLDHLVAMTDDVGIFQHARFDIPNRSFGYCTDDVARALIVALEASRDRATEQTGAKLATTYLAFLRDAQLPDGWFHNFMGYDRRWQDKRGTDDSFGRAVWGLGHCIARAPRDAWRLVAREAARCRPAARGRPDAPALARLCVRSAWHVACGRRRNAASALRAAVAPIAAAYRAVATPDWRWCEDDHDLRQRSHLRGADPGRYGARRSRAPARRARDAGLLRRRSSSKMGCSCRSATPAGIRAAATRARFGQQPLEAAAMVAACLAAHAATGDARYRTLAGLAGDWYFGRNTQRVPHGHQRRLPRRHRCGRREPEYGRRIDARVPYERNFTIRSAAA